MSHVRPRPYKSNSILRTLVKLIPYMDVDVMIAASE